MYSHVPEPLSFRLSASPWGGTAYKDHFDVRRQNFILMPLLEYLEGALSKVPSFKVRKTTLTLINVYSAFTQTSLGSHEIPTNTLISRGPLTFTFALKRREPVGLPVFSLWHTQYACTWGPNLQYAHDFVTVSVPISVCVAARIPSVMRPNLFRLYSIVGGWSKSFALNRPTLSLNTKGLKDRLYYKTLPKAMWYHNKSDWAYCREVWTLAPNILQPEYSDQFIEYYVKYLGKFHRKSKDSNAELIYSQIESIVKSYVLDAMQGQTVPDWMEGIIPPGDSLDVNTAVNQIITGEFPDG